MHADSPHLSLGRRRRSKSSNIRTGKQTHRNWVGLTAAEVLDRGPTSSSPDEVLEVLLHLFNHQHTKANGRVSRKTQSDRAVFLRRFFRDLHVKGGFVPSPDPRSLSGHHVRVMLNLWHRDQLAASTIQTYLSFLRGFAQWIGKPGLICSPSTYRLAITEQREAVVQYSENSTKSSVGIELSIAEVCTYDKHIGAALQLIHAFGLRRKEAMCLRPHSCVVNFSKTKLPTECQAADNFLWVRQGSKGGRERFVPIVAPIQGAALAYAQSVAPVPDGYITNPRRNIAQNLNHFSYVLRRFGLSLRECSAPNNALRHEVLVKVWMESPDI